MTQEEFGVDLFAVCHTAGRVLACQKQYAAVVLRDNREEIAAKRNELTALRQLLNTQFPALSDSDAAEFVKRYPWVLM